MQTPCWIILAPGTVKKLEPVVMQYARRDPDDDDCPWEMVDGERGYVAIIEEEPGSEGYHDEPLAKVLSKTSKRQTYLLTTNYHNDLTQTVEVFANGEKQGEVTALVEDALVTLGFRFDWMDRGEKVVLRREPRMVSEKPGEPTIWMWSVSQWEQMIRRGGDWYMLLDGVGAGVIDEILAVCAHDVARVRLLGVTLLEHVHYYNFKSEQRLERVFEVLDKLTSDRSRKVRAAAVYVRDDLVDSGDSDAVREEFPWLVNYYEPNVPRALALLDEDRPTVHRYVYNWFSGGIMNRAVLPEAAVAKLTQLATTSGRARELLDQMAQRRAAVAARGATA